MINLTKAELLRVYYTLDYAVTEGEDDAAVHDDPSSRESLELLISARDKIAKEIF